MRKHLVNWQKTKVQKFNMNSHPELLPESTGMYYVEDNEELTDKVRSLTAKAKRNLKPVELEVFKLLTGLDGREPLTQQAVAVKLHMTQGRVSQIWEGVRQQLCEEWEK